MVTKWQNFAVFERFSAMNSKKWMLYIVFIALEVTDKWQKSDRKICYLSPLNIQIYTQLRAKVTEWQNFLKILNNFYFQQSLRYLLISQNSVVHTVIHLPLSTTSYFARLMLYRILQNCHLSLTYGISIFIKWECCFEKDQKVPHYRVSLR